LCEAYNEELVSEPNEEALKPLREAIAAARKNIQKKIADQEREANKKTEESATGTLQHLILKHNFKTINEELEKAEVGLPQTLLDVEDVCNLIGG
jgi:hypothetical protein